MGEIGRRLGPQAEPLHPARQAFIPQGETALVSLTLVSLKSSPRVAIRVWWLPPSNKLPLDASHPLIKAVPRANSSMERLLSGEVVSQEGLAAWHPNWIYKTLHQPNASKRFPRAGNYRKDPRWPIGTRPDRPNTDGWLCR
jgi:hypothetical protein